MDEEFGVGNLIREEKVKDRHKVTKTRKNGFVEHFRFQKYAPKDLAGLRVEHAIDDFKEGQQVILTLKDKSKTTLLPSTFFSLCLLAEILAEGKEDDDDEEDVLINVNLADNELAKERAELSKKKTPGYRAYADDETVDEFGTVRTFLSASFSIVSSFV